MKISELQTYAESNQPGAWLIRQAFKNEWIDIKNELNASALWACRYEESATHPNYDQLRSYFCESVATALIHPDVMIAFRALLQAHGYFAEIKAAGPNNQPTGFYGFYSDCMLEARNRIETLLRKTIP